ncbi:MAG: helix-turn-helix transcriptional regulator [Lachnospiraceae bacterium]|nr:helix-turn-helix transcriptional regulator [Lachnospiraceae bacterium]
MPEQELNELIAKRISYYMEINHTTQQELADYIGVSQATISNWQKGIKTPRMSKIDKLCDYFSINRSDLMEDKSNQEQEHYYLNEETSAIAQEIFENKELRLLFDTAKDADPEDLSTVHNMLLALKRKEQNRE